MLVTDKELWISNYDQHTYPHLDYPEISLGRLIIDAFSKKPENIALKFMDNSITAEQLLTKAMEFAAYLQSIGLQKGSRIAICLPNTPQYVIAHTACLIGGYVSVGISPLLSPSEMKYQLNDCEASVLIVLDVIFEKNIVEIASKLRMLNYIIHTNIADFMNLPKLKLILGKVLKKIPQGKIMSIKEKTIINFKDTFTDSELFVQPVINPKEDLAMIIYTGGTTGGTPKGAELTHSSINSNLVQVRNWLDIIPNQDVMLSGFPFFHAGGSIVQNVCLINNLTHIVIPNPRDTTHIIDQIMKQQPSIVANVPMLYQMLISNPKIRNIPQNIIQKIKCFLSGGAPFTSDSAHRFEKTLNIENKVVELYGMTEGGPILTCNPLYGKKKFGTVGLPLPDVEIKIIDTKTGKEQSVGQPGEVIARGPQIMLRYHNKPQATDLAIRDGWLHTGDIGIVDEDGYLRIVDRLKDMIIVSGFKVFSQHVEAVISQHNAINQIAVVGIKNKDRPGSEVVKAFITLTNFDQNNEVIEDIKKYAKKMLSKYEVPKIWEVRDQLPLTSVGKINKLALRNENNHV